MGSTINAANGIAREVRCVVLCIRAADGVSPEQGYVIRDVLNTVETIGWWFLNPGMFTVYFLSEASGAERASSCEVALRRLAAANPSWASISFGSVEGEVVGVFTSAGILESPPLGGPVSAAMLRATANAS